MDPSYNNFHKQMLSFSACLLSYCSLGEVGLDNTTEIVLVGNLSCLRV